MLQIVILKSVPQSDYVIGLIWIYPPFHGCPVVGKMPTGSVGLKWTKLTKTKWVVMPSLRLHNCQMLQRLPILSVPCWQVQFCSLLGQRVIVCLSGTLVKSREYRVSHNGMQFLIGTKWQKTRICIIKHHCFIITRLRHFIFISSIFTKKFH